MHIGPYQLKNRLVVAPMAGVTDRPFRQLCKRMGAGMAVSEMVASNSLLYGSEKTLRRGNHEGEVEPRVVQIAGAAHHDRASTLPRISQTEIESLAGDRMQSLCRIADQHAARRHMPRRIF